MVKIHLSNQDLLAQKLTLFLFLKENILWVLIRSASVGTSNEYPQYVFFEKKKPASVAQLDARPTGDQEVAGSTPAEVGNILSWRLIMKYFLRSYSPFCWFKKGSCQFLVNVHSTG